MNEAERKRLTRRVTLLEIAFLAGAISCVTATAVVALWIFGG
jgi:hypothetical protein